MFVIADVVNVMDADATIKALEMVSAKLGFTVEHVYTVFVEAQPYLAIQDTVVAGITAVLVYISSKRVFTTMKAEIHNDDSAPYIGALMTAIVVGFFASILLSALISSTFTRLCCPEYMALVDLLRRI